MIAIIGIFFWMLVPSHHVGEAARKAQARNDESEIVIAVKAFYTEYGRYPVIGAGSTTRDAYYGVEPMPPTLSGTITNMGSNAVLFDVLRNNKEGVNASTVTALNPRQIVFLDMPEVRNLSHPAAGVIPNGSPNAGVWFDPWGSPYNVLIDADYNDTLSNPYLDAPGGKMIHTGVIAWSFGKNGILGGGPSIDNSSFFTRFSHGGFTSENGTAGYYYLTSGVYRPSSGDVISWQ